MITKVITLSSFDGEQTYCRKWHFDKMPKIVLGHFAEFFSSK
jgi:hypothetical protein